MKKIAMAATVAAMAVAVPAQADRPDNPGSQRSSQGSSHERGTTHRDGAGTHARRGRCTPRKVGYVARGDYVSSSLMQTEGAGTTETTHDDRFSGTLVVAVTRTNRHARADNGTTKTYTLTNARVRLADRNGDGTLDQPVAGDRTKVQGKITRLNRRCDSTGFTPELTIRRVQFLPPPDTA